MGKNTMMRKAIRGHLENNPGSGEVSLSSLLSALLPLPGEERSYKVTFSCNLLQTVASHPGKCGPVLTQGGPH